MQPTDWHKRYTQQARWTHDLRRYIFEKAGLFSAFKVLEVGCGPGVIISEVSHRTNARSYGLDIDLISLRQAASLAPLCATTCADAHTMPFDDDLFDIVFCHFLLLWVSDPRQVIREMVLVTRLGGNILMLTEPDYGGRIDYPIELAELGRMQEKALQNQGADPMAGRKLAGWCASAGLQIEEVGVLGGQWNAAPSAESQEMEWQVLEDDLNGMVDTQKLDDLRGIDSAAWIKGERVLFVPTFYAWGKKH